MKKYEIAMKTPVGLKYGTMDVEFDNDKISGNISLLGHTRPFEGTIDNDGNCAIKGRIVTLMRDLKITASGKIDENNIELSVIGERNVFKITGSTTEKREEEG